MQDLEFNFRQSDLRCNHQKIFANNSRVDIGFGKQYPGHMGIRTIRKCGNGNKSIRHIRTLQFLIVNLFGYPRRLLPGNSPQLSHTIKL